MCTFLFTILSKLNIHLFSIIAKVIMAGTLLILIILNLQDYFSVKTEKYNKFKVQLPTALRRFNHNIIKKLTNITDSKLMLLISLVLGVLISFGEFLCTGQIYLATIITILQTNSQLNIQALIYFIIYDFALITPLLLVAYIIHKSIEMFNDSEPCVIHRNYVMKKMIFELYDYLADILDNEKNELLCEAVP